VRLQGIKAIAEFFGVTTRQVSNWKAQGAPVFGRGKTMEAEAGEIQRWQDKKKGKGGGGGHQQGFLLSEKEYQDIRVKRLQGDELERKLAKEAGELISRKISESKFEVWAGVLLAHLYRWTNSLPPLLENQGARAIKAILDQEVKNFNIMLHRIETLGLKDGPVTRAEVHRRVDEYILHRLGGYSDDE
jgi:hypothetical protein